ncbi:hypothetical protein DYQ05_06620 [Treponema pedis]|nr:hypothetical protein DYQ05_06620 [Treponema pedis]
MIFEGERTTFSDKSFPLPLIPPLFSKEPLRGSAPKNPAQKGTSCTFLGFEFSCSKLAGSFFGAGCGGKGAYALCLCARGWFFLILSMSFKEGERTAFSDKSFPLPPVTPSLFKRTA